jgi:tRNA pseudouridine38-40 synthase
VPRYRLTIAYDGTDFCGWQKQEPPAGMDVAHSKLLGPAEEAMIGDAIDPGRVALRTVQAVVERAVREVVREPIVLFGASRTDTGVHARGQVAAFTCSDPKEPPAQTEGTATSAADASPSSPVLAPGDRQKTGWPPSRGTDTLIRAINSRLPEDVLVLGAEEVAPAFNPIGDCTAKAYSYSLHVSPHRPLWDRRFVNHIWIPLDLGAMNAAAARFVGEHDFAAFAASGHGRQSTVRTVFGCTVIEERETARQRDSETGQGGAEWERRLRIEISGNGFLWNMVRIIAGTLVEAGRGKMSPEDVAAAIESKDRRRAGPTLPPQGLCLDWVRYSEQP